jgi:hypothetical protein
MPTPGPGTAAVQAVYTNDLVSSFDIIKPDVWAKLIRRHGKQGAEFFSTIRALGFQVPTSNEDYSHFEDDWIHETVGVAAPIVVGAAGAVTTFTIAPASIDANGDFYIRKKDTILLQDGNQAYVTDITGTVVTLAPSSPTQVVTVVAADELVINSNAHGEGTTQPKGRFSGTRKYENNLQIIKETLEVTGTQMTDGLWFNQVQIPGENGTSISAYYVKGQQDTEYRIALEAEGAFLFGQKNTNPTVAIDPDTGKAIRTTEGIVPYITNEGNEVNYTPGSFTVSKFNEINKIADREHAPSYYCAFLGIDLHEEIDDTFVDYLKDTNVSFDTDMLGGGEMGKQKGINIGFKYLNKGGRHYAFKRLHSFSNQKTYGASQYNYPQWGLFIPLGMNKTDQGKLPTVGLRYKQLGKYNRFSEVWDVSGAGTGRKVIAEDVSNLYLRMHIGGHFQVGNQMFKVNP